MPTETGSLWRRILVICGLSAAAFAAPVLDLFGRNPEVFVANRTSPMQIVLFGVLIVAVIPALSFLILFFAGKVSERVASVAFGVIVAILAVATGLVVSRQVFPENTVLALLVAVVAGGVIFLLYRQFEGVLVWFSLALPAVLILFLSVSPTSRLIWSEPQEAVTSTKVANPAPIVMIQLDEMPAASIMSTDGTINESLFPNFARLAAEGTWYRNALSSSIATTQSVPATMTGRLGEKGLSPSSVDFPDNLFVLLEDSHEMHVIEWVADLCPEDVCPDYAGRAPARFSSLLTDVGVVYGHLTLPLALRENLPSIDNAWKGFLGQNDRPGGIDVRVDGLPVPNDDTRADWINWTQRIINGVNRGGPTVFSYAHLQAPHVPWQINPSGTHYERPEEYTEVDGVGGDGRWGADPEPAVMGFQRHLYQVGFLDAMLGRLFDKLDETETWDETMVIVVADHGASFVPGEHRRWPYENNRDDLYRVPMFIKYPVQTEGEVRDEPVFGIDVVPTVVDTLGIDTDWQFDGISLLDVAGTNRPHEPIWWCCNGDGADTSLDTLFAQVERNHRWIPDQRSWLGVAAVGPHAGLVGQPAAALEIENSDQLRWSLDLGATLGETDIDSGKVQTMLTGRIEFPAGVDPEQMLVVLNGTVAGTGYVSQDGPTSGALRGLVSETLVDDGTNEIDILVPYGNAWLSGSSDVLQLELLTADGRVLNLTSEGNRRIQVDKVKPTDGGWSVEGWAADVSAKQVPDTIYVFAGELLIEYGPPNTDNANVVRWFNSEDLLRSGFVFEIDGSLLPEGVEHLTVVAEFGDKAISDPARLSR